MTEDGNFVLVGDKWSGVLNHEWRIDPATQPALDEALNKLDARNFTMLTLQGKGETHLVVGGGDGRYVVCVSLAKDEFWNLLSLDPAEGVVLLNAGGQEGEFPARQVVGMKQARDAAQFFLATCQLDSTQKWLRQ